MVSNDNCNNKVCCPSDKWGWLGKKFLGLSLGLWLVFFALVPHSARGLSWTARAVIGFWDTGAKVVQVDRPVVDRQGRPDRGQ
jgi:hypothetical protein